MQNVQDDTPIVSPLQKQILDLLVVRGIETAVDIGKELGRSAQAIAGALIHLPEEWVSNLDGNWVLNPGFFEVVDKLQVLDPHGPEKQRMKRYKTANKKKASAKKKPSETASGKTGYQVGDTFELVGYTRAGTLVLRHDSSDLLVPVVLHEKSVS